MAWFSVPQPNMGFSMTALKNVFQAENLVCPKASIILGKDILSARSDSLGLFAMKLGIFGVKLM